MKKNALVRFVLGVLYSVSYLVFDFDARSSAPNYVFKLLLFMIAAKVSVNRSIALTNKLRTYYRDFLLYSFG